MTDVSWAACLSMALSWVAYRLTGASKGVMYSAATMVDSMVGSLTVIGKMVWTKAARCFDLLRHLARFHRLLARREPMSHCLEQPRTVRKNK